MPGWTLVDTDRDLYVDNLSLTPYQVGGPARGYTVSKRRLQGGPRDGVDVVEVDTGALRFTVLLTRGMSLWKAAGGDVSLSWRSPVKGPVHPQFVPLWEPSGIGWLSGFDELLVRCGLESNGAPEFDDKGHVRWPLHGRLANLPAHKAEVRIDGDTGEICLTGEVDESRLFGNKLRLRTTYRARAGEARLSVRDEITAIGAGPSELQLLYHINLGEPLVTPGARITAPIRKLMPRTPAAAAALTTWQDYGPQQLQAPEQVYFTELAADGDGRTQVVLASADRQRGFSLGFNVRQNPYFILWKNPQESADGYVSGLEPAINFPNPRSFEAAQGRVRKLAAGETFVSELTLEPLSGADRVAAETAAVERLAASVTPEIIPQPGGGWVAP